MHDQNVFDGLLILEYRSGDKNALTLLVKRYHNKFCRHAYWYTKDINVSKDIAQDCWHQILNKMGSLRDPNSFGSWAMTIVTRKSLDYLKKIGAERKNLAKTQKEICDEELPIDNSNTIEKLSSAINDLPSDHRIVLDLFYTEDYSLKEISDILEISVGTVKSRLFHAREKLKTILK